MRNRLLLPACAALLTAGEGLAARAAAAQTPVVGSMSAFFAVDPRATFRRTFDDAPAAPLVLSLGGAAAGSILRVSASGMFSFGSGLPNEDVTDLSFSALFSSSDLLLGDALRDRVPGAIALRPGQPAFVSEPTARGGFDTDIAQDFSILAREIEFVVPDGARFFFVGINDSFFGDNTSPDPARLGVTASITPAAVVPEPATVTLLGLGLVGAAVVGRRARARTRA